MHWYSTAALQGRGRSPDGLWAISHADGEGTGSQCLHRQGADNGGSREQYCTRLHVPTPQRQAIAGPRQPANTCHSMSCQPHRLLQRCPIRCRERRSSATSNGFERCCETRCWYWEVQPHHPKSSAMFSTGSLYSTESATKSPYWLGTVFTASARPISVTFAPRGLQPPDELTCIQRRLAIF